MYYYTYTSSCSPAPPPPLPGGQTVSVIGLGTAGDEDSSGPTRLVNKVFFHHRGHAYPSNLEVFGRSKIIPDIGADAEEDKSVRFTYELHLTEKRFLSRNDRPCAEEGWLCRKLN